MQEDKPCRWYGRAGLASTAAHCVKRCVLRLETAIVAAVFMATRSPKAAPP
ncbi:protein yipf2 [Ahrensia sp. R2A130]|nr:protein yipf2 [Ahrensia sp. R2A130]